MTHDARPTRDRLVDTALRLFREVGYPATTMRRIAAETGVSLGNAYYYFASKDELVHELYRQIQGEHRDRTLPRLVDGAPLADNLRVALSCGLDVMAPYHGFGSTFVQVALPLSSSASPFSITSTDARTMAIDLMGEVVARSRRRPPAALQKHLPTLLWLTYLAVTLFWVTDSSTGQIRSRQLVATVAPMVARVVNLARLPVARGLVVDLAKVVDLVTLSAPTITSPRTREEYR